MRWNEMSYSGWGRALQATGEVARPERMQGLTAETAVPAIGNRRSYGDACTNNGGKAVDMSRLDRVLSFDAETGLVEAEAGMPIGELARLFAPLGWMPAVMPGTGFATVGGCIANDVHGKNHHGVGTFGQHVQSVQLVGADGAIQTVSPDQNKTLFEATLGGLGQTGIILPPQRPPSPCSSRIRGSTSMPSVKALSEGRTRIE